MTVTVIIIIAVIVVLAILVLLLLGMRSLSIGSREDDYDEYEDEDYDAEDADAGSADDRTRGRERGRGRGEKPAPRGRARRSRQDDDGRTERRPKGRRKREDDDWGDDPDSLSDNDFWSSLSEDGPAQRPSAGPRDGFGDRDGAPDVTAYEYEDDYDDAYEDYDDQESGPPGATTVMPAARGGNADPAADLAVLASLGQNSVPQVSDGREHQAPEPGRHGQGTHGEPAPSPRQEERRERPAPPPAQQPDRGGLPQPSQTAAPAASPPEDPLGPGSWSPGSSYSPSYGDPLGASSGSRDPFGDRPSYDSGTMSRSDYPGLPDGPERPVSDPLDPGFRPSVPAPDADVGSPIWSSLDTGAHQRSDLGFGGGQSDMGRVPGPGMGGGPLPRPAGEASDPLTGGYRTFPEPSYDTGAQRYAPYDSGTHNRGDFGAPGAGRPEYDTGNHTRPTYDSGTFSLDNYDTGPHTRAPYDSGTHNRGDFGAPGPGRPEYDTGAQRYAPYDSGTHNRGDFGAPGAGRPEYDTGNHTRPTYDSGTFSLDNYDTGPHTRAPYDSGTHNRASYQGPNPPLWGGRENGEAFGAPYGPGGTGAPGGMSDPGGRGGPGGVGDPGTPVRGVPSPFNQGPAVPPPGHPRSPGGPAFPGGAQNHPYGPHPTNGHPADQARGDLPPGYGGYAGPSDRFDPPATGPAGGYSDLLNSGYPTGPQPQQPEYGGYPGEGWHPGGEGRHPSGPQAPAQYPAEPYDRYGYGREHHEGGYEGGYEDGRFL
ncbi:hypothetical protein [Nocardiopsis quinghaiensis]|uniref:hypothetical protein n=1 Tax=Nocardiopsis quinghaiensis TaxID=464995 RepID=UPI00123A9B0C|nr:hypothetical protein [Nocardiopsis quinghaiensis]